MNAEGHCQVIQLRQINPQRAVFDFGNGATLGIFPASILQPVGQIILRPVELVTPFADLSPDKIPLFHRDYIFAAVFTRIHFTRL